MLIDEARVHYLYLLADGDKMRRMGECAEANRLERLQRRVAVISARLGIGAGAA